jgi:hypothetical protein
LVVYRLGQEGDEPESVLKQELPGSASSWTPSLGRCLQRGGRYAWSVRALGGETASEWSAPALFRVVAGPTQRDFEAALATVQQYLAQRETPVAAAPASAHVAAEDDPDEKQDTSSAGSLATRLIPEAPETVSFVTDGAVGVGTSTPLADLHVIGGGDNSAGVLIATPEGLDGGVAELMFAETPLATWGMKLRYDGDTDTLAVLGKRLDSGESLPWLEIDRDSGATTFGGIVSGNGSGLTSVNADTLDGMDSTAFSTGAHTTDTNAATLCAADEYLDGAGTCTAIPVDTNTNAATECAGGEYLDGSGTCKSLSAQIAAELACSGAGGSTDRYTDCGNGTVRDNNTGLIWLKDASCADLAGTDTEGRGDWATAQSAAAALASGTCGLTDGSVATDWRQPWREEQCSEWWGLFFYYCPASAAPDSLVDITAGPPTVAADHPFVGVQSADYWSGTWFDDTIAWSASLSNGRVSTESKNDDYYVWPVRGGQ